VIRLLRNSIFLIAAAVLVGLFAVNLQGTGGPSSQPRGHGGHGHGGHGHGGHDHAHEEGGVTLTDAKIAAAGIELATAGPAVLRDSLVLNGILQPNQEALVQVTPRFPGVVREVGKRIGDRVERGTPLAKVESNQSLTVYELRSPIAGTVIDRQIALGEYVTEQKPAFTIADLGTVWVDFSVYRRDLKRVRPGDTVVVDAEDGGPPIETKISYVSPIGSSDTQSALARAVVDNAEQRLRPGLFVTGRLILSAKPVPIAVKISALQTLENRTVVFVRNGDKFEPREVELGERDPESIEILFGVLEGDVYAARNSFVIKAESAKGSATHEH
jgi:cobalt-zinc-cadmium efflux system membrane fusion protein